MSMLIPPRRFQSLTAALLALPLLLSSCSRRGHFLFGRSSWGILVLVLDVMAWLDIAKQPNWSTERKLIWGLVILFFPLLGLILYYLFANRQKV